MKLQRSTAGWPSSKRTSKSGECKKKDYSKVADEIDRLPGGAAGYP